MVKILFPTPLKTLYLMAIKRRRPVLISRIIDTGAAKLANVGYIVIRLSPIPTRDFSAKILISEYRLYFELYLDGSSLFQELNTDPLNEYSRGLCVGGRYF